MAFYKCNVCRAGTNSARSCGRTPCKLEVSFCEAHGGDASAIYEIQEHMRSHDAPALEPWGDRPPRYNGAGEPCDTWTGPCSCGATHTNGV